MRKLMQYAVIALGVTFAPAAHAACKADKAGDDLTGAEAQQVYECMADRLYAGYNKGNTRWVPSEYVKNYRDWVKASTFPAAPGTHGNRFLVTWVNDVGAKEYMKYAEEPNIPAGTLIAKDSFSVNAKGKVRPGPIFFMEKVAAGKSPKTGDWYYSIVAPNGNAVGVNVMKACNQCHMDAFGFQGGLGYPVEEARVTN